MKYAIVENGIVVNAVVASSEFAQQQGWIELKDNAAIGWSYDGSNFAPPEVKTKTLDEVKKEFPSFVQRRLDNFARTRDYDDIKSASAYAGCGVEKFNIEGAYCRDIMAQTWDVFYRLIEEIEVGTRQLPISFNDMELLLPELVWP